MGKVTISKDLKKESVFITPSGQLKQKPERKIKGIKTKEERVKELEEELKKLKS